MNIIATLREWLLGVDLVSVATVKEVADRMDVDRDGYIELRELIRWLKTLKE